MANEIKQKFSAPSGITISFTGLLGSTTSVGRTSEWVDNSVNRYQKLMFTARTIMGGSPTGSRALYFYGLRDDGSGIRTDAAPSSSGAWTGINATPIGALVSPSSPSSGAPLCGEFFFENPGPRWSIGISQDICSTWDIGTGSYVNYIGINPEIQ